MKYGGITLVHQRQEKRIQRLIGAPVSVLEIFLGKMLGRMLQPMLLGSILMVAGVVPQTFKTVALFMPTYWAVQGIQDVIYFGKSRSDVLPERAVLCASGALLTAIAIPNFRRN